MSSSVSGVRSGYKAQMCMCNAGLIANISISNKTVKQGYEM